MSDHPPLKARPGGGQTSSDQGKPSIVSIADRSDSTQVPPDSHAPADAATLGFADLAGQAPGAELAEFRELRARLFGDIDVSEPAFEETAVEEEPPTDEPPEPLVPMQLSIAYGALTAAEIAAAENRFGDDDADLEVDDEPEDDGELEEDDALEDDETLEEDLDSPDARVEQADPAGALDESALSLFGPVEEPLETAEPEPEPQPQPAGLHVRVGAEAGAGMATTTAQVVVEPPHRNAPIFAAFAALAIAAAVVGWLLLFAGDGTERASPGEADAGQAAQDTQMQASAAVEIDGKTLRTSEQFVFDEAISQISLSLPQRPPGAAAAGFDPLIRALEISVPGQPRQRVSNELRAGSSITVDLDDPSDTVAISYLAEGAVLRTEPSSAHRALAFVTPLRIAAADSSTSLVVIKGPNVLNLGCATGSEAMRACGQRTEQGWEVALTAPATDVIAQVDLPE